MKILLIQHRQIGDVLMCTPAVRALRKHYPDADITFMVEPFSYNALEHNPNIDHFIIPSKKMGMGEFLSLMYRIRKERYDVTIDFFRNPKSAWFTWLTRAKKRISFTGEWRNYAYNIKIDPGGKSDYAGVQKLKLLRPLGIEEEKDCVPEFFITEKERKWADELWDTLNFTKDDFVISVSPVSRKAYRVWPGEYYAKLCDYLMQKYKVKILLTWGPGEESFIEPIVKNMKETPVMDYPMPTLKQLQALLEKSSLFIGNDNGPRHMAIAGGTPTLGLFSKVNPYHWTPPDVPKHVILRPDPEKNEQGREILLAKNLSVEKAIKAADRIFLD